MKIVKIGTLDVKLVSRAEFAKIVGLSFAVVKKWVERGILLPPAFIDNTNRAYNFGRGAAPKKFYAYAEAVVAREEVRKYEFGRGREISAEFIENLRDKMLDIRKRIVDGDYSVVGNPLILEFETILELTEYLGEFVIDAGGLAEALFAKGNRFIGSKNNKVKGE